MQNFNLHPPSKMRILNRTVGKNPIFFEAIQTHVQWEGDTKNSIAIWDFRSHLLQDWGPFTNTVLTVDTENQVFSKF